MKISVMVHKSTGEVALVSKLPGGLMLAQFDNLRHSHSHGWHLYTRTSFRKLSVGEMRHITMFVTRDLSDLIKEIQK